MKKKMNNKGFSLVELIIVIAIMLVLVGILAPQFIRYVARSRVAADVTNAQEIAAAIDVAIADQQAFTGFGDGTDTAAPVAGGGAVTGLPGITTVPNSRAATGLTWHVEYDATNGVTLIELGGEQIYPDAADYQAAH